MNCPTRSSSWISLGEFPPDRWTPETEEIIVWHVLQGPMVCAAGEWRTNRFFRYWMKMPEDGWIDIRERKPTREDGNMSNCLLVEYLGGTYRVTGWHQYRHDTSWRRWRRTPEPPEDYLELRMETFLE